MLLAIDTATPQVSASLWNDDGPVASSRATEGGRHGEVLVPAVSALVKGSGHTMRDLTAIAVDVGPGLFTGLRVGVTTAKALAAALGLPAVGLTSLEILAHPHRRQPALIAGVVDARRHEVFRALYRPDRGGLIEVIAPGVVTPAVLADELAAQRAPVLAVGDGARRYADSLLVARGAPHGIDDGWLEIAGPIDAYPDAEVLGEIAVARLAAGRYTDAAGLDPCYLRQADVRIGWDQREAPRPVEPSTRRGRTRSGVPRDVNPGARAARG